MAPSFAASTPKTKTILIVEDHVELRDGLVQLLREDGYQVEVAGTGLDALEKLRWGLRPSCVLLDMQMHVMTGWEFRSEQRRDPALATIPVVAMTAGHWKPQDLSDFPDRIDKPIDTGKLRELLRRFD